MDIPCLCQGRHSVSVSSPCHISDPSSHIHEYLKIFTILSILYTLLTHHEHSLLRQLQPLKMELLLLPQLLRAQPAPRDQVGLFLPAFALRGHRTRHQGISQEPIVVLHGHLRLQGGALGSVGVRSFRYYCVSGGLILRMFFCLASAFSTLSILAKVPGPQG